MEGPGLWAAAENGGELPAVTKGGVSDAEVASRCKESNKRYVRRGGG